MLPEQPHVGVVVHPFGLLRERLRHVRTTTEPLPYRLRPAKSTVHLVLPLALVGEVVAVAAQEILPQPVQHSHPPAAARSRADEPGPLSSEVARRPAQGHGLLHIFPFSAWTASVPVGEDHLLRLLVPNYRTADGACLPSSPRPAQGGPASWYEQIMSVKVADIYAMAFVGRGLLVEPVPVAATHAAHENFSPLFLPK